MEALIAGAGFIHQILSIAHALGLDTGLVESPAKRILESLGETNLLIENLTNTIAEESAQIRSMVSTAVIIEVHSRLSHVKSISPHKLELLIRLIYCLKEAAPNVVFAVVVKYNIGTKLATLGFAGASSDAIEDLVMKVENFIRTISHVSAPKTAYSSIRIRGKYDSGVESFCTALVTTIVTDVCELSREIELEDKMQCPVVSRGEKTIVMLQPTEFDDDREEFDRLRRVFLVGDTRSGKSTIGNALVEKPTFMTSKGMTGTMRIERSERVEDFGDQRWVTEFYDTPGLNDKDGLDVWYESAIEDQVRILQRASSFIMTVSVDSGITGSALKSLKSYKSLFGPSMSTMMIIVLTINEPATLDELNTHLQINVPTVMGLDRTILEQNIFCVSLHDLRESEKSDSQKVIRAIAKLCRNMPMKVIEALVQKYRAIQNALLQKSGNLKKEVQLMMDDGWQTYDHLTNMYEQSPYIKMTGEGSSGRMNGFVMKNSDKKLLSLAVGTLGLVNCIRKIAIHISVRGKKATKTWEKFLQTNALIRHDSNLMRHFGDMLHNGGMGVIVKDMSTLLVGTFRIKRYQVIIFDPVSHTHEELSAYLQEVIQESYEEWKPEIINELMKCSLPPAIRSKRPKSAHHRK